MVAIRAFHGSARNAASSGSVRPPILSVGEKLIVASSRPRGGRLERSGRRRRAPDQLPAGGRRLPDPPREGRHRLQQVLEAASAHEEDLGIGRDHGDVGLPGPAFEQTQLAEDVTLAHLADEPALDPDREVAGEQDVEAVGLVALDDDVLAALERVDLAEDREAGELARGHVLDDTVRARLDLRLEPRPRLRQLQPRAWLKAEVESGAHSVIEHMTSS